MSIHSATTVRARERRPRDVGPTAPEHDFQLLLQFMEWLEGAEDDEALATLLDDLAAYLREHFAAEERPEGVFDWLLGRSPGAEGTLIALRREHASLLQAIARLRAETQPALRAVAPSARRTLALVVARLRAHEAREQMLLHEALWRDLGGGD